MPSFRNYLTLVLLLSIVAIYLIFCLYQLNDIPGEWFGDISIVNNYVINILNGTYPFEVVTSAGPLYFYLISPLIYLFGISYLSYKIISVGVGALGLITIFYLAKELTSTRTALITALITATSFWYVVWARLGNYNIVTPLISSASMFAFVKYKSTDRLGWLIASIIVASTGLFIYAGLYALPIALLLLILLDFFEKQSKYNKGKIALIAVAYGLAAFLFALLIILNVDTYRNGYLGEKFINGESFSPYELILRFLINFYRTLTMFHLEGDVVFRWNVSMKPLIDTVSGAFLMIGLIGWVITVKKIWIFIPIVLILIPSVLPGHPAIEVPSSPRTMAILPLVFILIGFGIDFTYEKLKIVTGKIVAGTTLVIIIGIVIYLNVITYFVEYPRGLPNQNVPFGRVIADYINTLPNDVTVYLTTLGWGDWGQPEFDSIYYSLKNIQRRVIMGLPECNSSKDERFVIITAPVVSDDLSQMRKCYPDSVSMKHRILSQNVFISFRHLNN